MNPTDQMIARALSALAELRGLRCSDPAAGRANETVRLAAHTVECFLLRELASGRAPSEDVRRSEPLDLGAPGQPGEP